MSPSWRMLVCLLLGCGPAAWGDLPKKVGTVRNIAIAAHVGSARNPAAGGWTDFNNLEIGIASIHAPNIRQFLQGFWDARTRPLKKGQDAVIQTFGDNGVTSAIIAHGLGKGLQNEVSIGDGPYGNATKLEPLNYLKMEAYLSLAMNETKLQSFIDADTRQFFETHDPRLKVQTINIKNMNSLLLEEGGYGNDNIAKVDGIGDHFNCGFRWIGGYPPIRGVFYYTPPIKPGRKLTLWANVRDDPGNSDNKLVGVKALGQAMQVEVRSREERLR